MTFDFNVVATFGADPCGVADSGAAINAAFAACLAAGGGTVYFPRGTYKHASGLVWSVTGSVPKGVTVAFEEGAVLKPTSAITTALTLATDMNTDGTPNRLIVRRLRLDGVNTTAKKGVLVGDNAGNLSGNIILEDPQILRFAGGAGGIGLHVKNVVGFEAYRPYIGRCGTNVLVDGSVSDLPTNCLFHDLKSREADDATGGSGRGVEIVQGYRVMFLGITLLESNDREGFYCVPTTGKNVLDLVVDGIWAENNQVNGSSTTYHIKCDGTSASTVSARFARGNFSSGRRAVYLKNTVNTVLDELRPENATNQIVIEGSNCQGCILNWPQNNAPLATVVTFSGGADPSNWQLPRRWAAQRAVFNNLGDQDFTYTPQGAAAAELHWINPLSVNRTLFLASTGALPGDVLTVVRRASATGSAVLNVGNSPTLKTLALGQWCDVGFDGSSWVLRRFGSL